jgi:hypothetical protein
MSAMENEMSKWGDFITNKRIGLGFTLRSFCIAIEYDCGNLSKMERGILLPFDKDSDMHKKITKVLKLSCEEIYNLVELSEAERQPLRIELNQEKQRREDAEKIVFDLAKNGVNLSVHTEAKKYKEKYNQ